MSNSVAFTYFTRNGDVLREFEKMHTLILDYNDLDVSASDVIISVSVLPYQARTTFKNAQSQKKCHVRALFVFGYLVACTYHSTRPHSLSRTHMRVFFRAEHCVPPSFARGDNLVVK